MGVINTKIYRDLWKNRGRTIQVVLIIAIGAAAIGMILGTRDLVINGMQGAWRSMHPAMINLFVGPEAIDENDLLVLKSIEGVVEIEGMSTKTIEWRLNPNDEWQPGGLTFRPDYKDQLLNKLELVEGDWPGEKTVSIGQGDDGFFKMPKNGMVYLRVDDKEYTIHTGGVVYNQMQQPAYFGGTAQFYASQDEYERIVGDRDFNQVMVTGVQYDKVKTAELADRLQERLEKMDSYAGRWVLDPNKHFFQDQLDGIFLLLGVMGMLALALGLLLVYTTINAIISQQMDQIGIMKAIGARTGQVLRLYLTSIFFYSILSLLIAVPPGVVGAWAISSWMVGSFGATVGGFEYSPTAVLAMVLIVFLAPLLASLIPIFSGARITVREAISTYGLSTKAGLIERLLANVKSLSRMLLLTISNTFRNKGRVIQMQITLVISGLIFMMVVSLRDSVNYSVKDVLFSILNADVTFLFDNPQRIQYLEELTHAYPGVKEVEMWGFAGVTLRPAGQKESEDDESAQIWGVPLPTQTYSYQLRAGRWLDPQDSHAIVLNQKLAKDVGVGVGDWITAKYSEKNQVDWQVVGLVYDPILTTVALGSREVLLQDLHDVGRAQSAWIQTESGDMQTEIAVAKGLRLYYKKNGVKVSPQKGIFNLGGDSTTQAADAFIAQFNIFIALPAILAVIIGAVGGIALSGVLTLSVLERRREIGVMRAIGASSWSIARLFIGEGLLLGWMSWLLCLPLSIPAGRLMVQALGSAIGLDLVYKYTPVGALLWLAIITILSILASWLPARGATRISIRESLAYT
jgi:putative ABC transport system permease protein